MNSVATTLSFARDAARPIQKQRASTADPPRGFLTHAIHTDFQALENARDEWDTLAAKSSGDIYSTFDWCSIWWQHYGYGRELQIHIFRRGHDLVGIVPTFYEKIRLGPLSLRTVRLTGCDHSVTTCGPIILPCEKSDVLNGWTRVIQADQRLDVIQLGPLAGYDNAVDTLAGSMSTPDFACQREQTHPQMIIDLPDTYEAYLAALPKKKRGELRREERDFASCPDATCRVIKDPAEVAAEFERFADLHQSYWHAEHRLGHFGDWPQSRPFHREMIRAQAASGRALLILIESGAQLLAAEYCYLFGERLHWFLSARQPDFPGRVGFIAMIREAIARSATQLDAMRGYYDYKKWLGARVVNQGTVTLIPDNLRARRRFARFQTAARLLNLAYYRIWFSRMAPKLPLSRRPLRPSWIRTQL